MKNEAEVLAVIEKLNADRTRTFAEFIAELYKGKLVEIYLGDSFEEVSFEQTSMAYPAVFCGKVIAAYRECLILSTLYHEKSTGLEKIGNIVYINERAIRALNEIDGNGILEDLFSLSRNSIKVKESFDGKK